MLNEFARMSSDDGLVMQLHIGSLRDHNSPLAERFGRDIGADIPVATDGRAACGRCSRRAATSRASR